MILVFSDIHADKKAAIFIESIAHRFDLILCAGDIVGYGTEFEYVIDMLISLDVKVVKGNHDSMVVDPDRWDLGAVIPAVSGPILQTRSKLKGKYLDYLKALPLSLEVGDIFMLHAPSLNTYISSKEQAECLLNLTTKSTVVFGHTHIQELFTFGTRRVINPGSTFSGRRGSSKGFAVLDEDKVIFEVLL